MNGSINLFGKRAFFLWHGRLHDLQRLHIRFGGHRYDVGGHGGHLAVPQICPTCISVGSGSLGLVGFGRGDGIDPALISVDSGSLGFLGLYGGGDIDPTLVLVDSGSFGLLGLDRFDSGSCGVLGLDGCGGIDNFDGVFRDNELDFDLTELGVSDFDLGNFLPLSSFLRFLQHATAATKINRCRTRSRILFLKELKQWDE